MAEGFSRRGMGGFTGGAQMYDMPADPTWSGDFGASEMATPDADAINALINSGVQPAAVVEAVKSGRLPNQGHFGPGWLQDFLENLNYSWSLEKERANQKTMDYLVRTGQMPPISVLEEQSTSPMVEALLPAIQTGDVSGGLSVKEARDIRDSLNQDANNEALLQTIMEDLDGVTSQTDEYAIWGASRGLDKATIDQIRKDDKEKGIVLRDGEFWSGLDDGEVAPPVLFLDARETEANKKGTLANVDTSSDWELYGIDPAKDSTVKALEKKAKQEGLYSIIDSNQSDWDKQWARSRLLGLEKTSDVVIDLPGGKIVNGKLVLDESEEAWEEFLNWPDIKSDKKDETLAQRNNRWALGNATAKEKETDRYKEWDSLTGTWLGKDTEDALKVSGLEKIVDNISLGVASADDEGMGSYRFAEAPGVPSLDVGMEDARLAFPSGLPPLDEITAQQIIQGDVPASKSGVEAFEDRQWRESAARDLQGLIRQEEPRVQVAGPGTVARTNWLERLDPESRKWQLDNIFGTGTDRIAPMVDDFSAMPQDIVARQSFVGEDEESLAQKIIAETLGIPVDLVNTAITAVLQAAGAPQYIIESPVGGRQWLMENKGMTIDDLVSSIREYIMPTAEAPGFPAVTEEYPGLPWDWGFTSRMGGMEDRLDDNITSISASRARTQDLNTLGRELLPHEIEAIKRGDLINQQTQNVNEVLLDKSPDLLVGLSPAMRTVLEGDPVLMEQYLAKRDEIMAMIERVTGSGDPTPGGFTTKTRYVSQPLEHEDWYPGSQAAANQAGFWGPLALGWNPKYNAYRDSQRRLMGKQPGERFWSDDWIQNFGWMTPEQINAVIGY